MSKLALTLVATNAAPTSPNVLGTEVLIEDPDSVITVRSSLYRDSTAIRRDRPAKMIIVLAEPEVLVAASVLTKSTVLRRGVVVVSVWNAIREEAVLA